VYNDKYQHAMKIKAKSKEMAIKRYEKVMIIELIATQLKLL